LGEWPTAEVERAEAIMAEYLQQKRKAEEAVKKEKQK
jgi:hypothetical protein